MIVQFLTGCLGASVAGLLVMFGLKNFFRPVLVSSIMLLATEIGGAIFVFASYSSLDIEALFFWIWPLVVLMITLFIPRSVLSTNISQEKAIIDRRLSRLLLLIAGSCGFISVAVFLSSYLTGNDSFLLMGFATFLLFSLTGFIGFQTKILSSTSAD